ncbi:MAG: efflux RND transporter permease subunit [Acidobacteria bacterium]|nr:MAG: efflux RND transporter permease subunit [Acidobacteriota bacterium]
MSRRAPGRLGLAGSLSRFFIDAKLTPLLVVAALALGGLATSLTPRDEEPQIVVPIVDLFTALPGAGAREVESRVTIPLEREMWRLPGVEYVYSTSMPGRSLITVRFYVGDDLEASLVKVHHQLRSAPLYADPEIRRPLVKARSIDDVPVLALTLWSSRYGSFELRRIGAQLRRELAALDDVAEIRLIGGERRQLRVLLDPARLAARGLDPASVAAAVRMQNAAAAAGSFDAGNREVLVDAGAFLHDADEVAALVVGVYDGRPVYLRDVAEIADGPAEPSSYVLYRHGDGDGGGGGELYPAVTLAIAKKKGSDAARVVGRVMGQIEELRGRLLPQDVEVSITRDYGATASEKAGELLLHLAVAIVSVTVVIGLALGWRGALVVFVSVPVSFALTLFVYYVFGYTLNRVTLFALIFVTGIVVDDSIIVVENIVRHLSAGRKPPLQAALEAVDEVGNPTILATLTVIASVLPMAFVRGLMGPYMLPMPVGASLAMTFSLLVALIAAPWFAFRLVRGGDGGEEGAGIESTRVYRLYRRLLLPLLLRPRRGALFLGAVAALLVASVALFPLRQVSVKMLPFDNKSEVQVIVDMPEGTPLEATQRVAREIADELATVPEVTDLQLYAGTAGPINFNGLVRHYDLRAGANVADLQVNLRHKKERAEQSHDVAKRLRRRLAPIAERHGAAVKVAEIPPGPPVLATLLAEIYGPSDAERLRVAEEVRRIFAATPGVVDVDWWVEAPQRKLVFEVDREKAALSGVPAAQVARTLRLVLAGEDAGTLHRDDELEPVPIRLELPRAERSSAAALGDVYLRSQFGEPVPLSELVRVRPTVLEPYRYRKNLKPVVYVAGEVAGEAESPVYAILDMKDRLAAIELPAGGVLQQYYRDEPTSGERAAMKWDGEWHITYEVFRDLGAAFGVVLVLIYLLIVGWFGSLRVPLVMMIAIPLSLVGILPGHLLFGAFFTATSMIGFIALAGIMVRNSVLLIDFVNLSLERGRSLAEAVLEAGAVRFRPIVLTAGTVVVGAFVILFDPIFEGLAISLMMGALASTLLTLVVVPLVYFMVEKRHHREPLPAAWRGAGSDEPPAPPAAQPEETS